MPDRQDCAGADPQCPTDGRRHYNTDVVFSDNGTLVARYHKQNLYKEKEFDVPPEIEYVTFNTPFAGKFAIFTCFDILFREPAITLLEKHQVKQVVFPTAWINKLPLLSAVQFQQAFATAWGINLLAANIHLPSFKMTGSGIFTPTNSTFHYDIETSKGRLLVSKVPVPPPVQDDPSTASQSPQSPLTQNPECSRISTAILEPPAVFHANMMNDNFTFTLLTGKKGELSVCNGHLCCYLTYQQSNTNGELYAIGAFNGLHKGHRQSFLEVCALVRCAGDSQDTCGADISQASTTFDFCLQGNFSTPYVYPSILASGVDLVIPDGVGWTSGSFLMSKEGMSKGLVTAALYGRVYDKDKV
ncbi:BTD Biotinidase, partial [Amia calva]|nr:BTD Biotinidase [Amia calva]